MILLVLHTCASSQQLTALAYEMIHCGERMIINGEPAHNFDFVIQPMITSHI
jgi:hypothetical protein